MTKTTDQPDEADLNLLALTNDDGAWARDEDGLSVMERKFCIAALEKIGEGNSWWRRAAAEAAGYKDAANAAYRLIRRTHVNAFITKHLTEAADVVKVDRSFVLQRAVYNMAVAEAKGDLRVARQYLDIVAKHADVKALVAYGNDAPDGRATANVASLPFDIDGMSLDDKRALLDIIARNPPRDPAEHDGPAAGVDSGG